MRPRHVSASWWKAWQAFVAYALDKQKRDQVMTDTKSPEKITLSVMTCRSHGHMDIQIGDQRVTPDKCCGSWSLVRKWDVPREDVIRAAEEAEEAT